MERKCRIASENFEDTTVDCNTHWQQCLKRAQRLQKETAAKDIEYDSKDGRVGGVCPTDKSPEIQLEVLGVSLAELECNKRVCTYTDTSVNHPCGFFV